MQRGTGGGEKFAAAREIDAVVDVAGILRTPPSSHEAATTKPTKVIRHETLLCAEPIGQFPHSSIGATQLFEQPPPQRMRRQLKDIWWRMTTTADRTHPPKLHQNGFMH